MEEKETLQLQAELRAHAENVNVTLENQRAASNEQAIRRILEYFPNLHNKLVYMQNKGYVVSHAERNALIVAAVKASVLSLEQAVRQERMSRKKLDELKQKEIYRG